MRSAWAMIVLACAMGAGCGQAAVPAGVVVERQQLLLEILDDGSVRVREDLTVRFAAESRSFERRVPIEHADLFFDAAAGMDGQVLPSAGPRAARVEIDPDLWVRWTFPPSAGESRVFTLTYRAAGAVARTGARGALRWSASPLSPAYPVEAMEIALTLPSRSAWLAPPVPDGPDWTVRTHTDGFTAARRTADSREPVVVGALFSVEGLGIVEPEWQFREARNAELALAWASSGVFIILVAIGIGWMVAVQYRPKRQPVVPGDAGPVPASGPADRPAVKLALSRRGHVRGRATWDAAVAGLPADVDAATVLSHEQVILDHRWIAGEAGGASAGRATGATVSRRDLHRFHRALVADLVAVGLVSIDRVAVANGLRSSGLVVIAFGVLTAAAIAVAIPQFGAWPFALPASLVVGGAVLLPQSARLSLLTEAGERRATLRTFSDS